MDHPILGGLVTQQGPERDLKDSVYRLDRFDVEVGGRWREFGRSLLLVSMLLLVQQPLRSAAGPGRGETLHIDPAVALRISLIIDCVFIISYFVLAYRAWGLVRASGPSPAGQHRESDRVLRGPGPRGA